MHVGCILTFSAPENGDMDFQRVKSYINSRLPISPIFRRKLSTQVLDVDRPAWIDDKGFNIDQHIFEKQLSPEAEQQQKKDLISHFFSTTLDLRRPLWEMLFINKEGKNEDPKPDNEFYILLKFHHAAVDGMSAEKILSGLLSEEKTVQTKLDDSWSPVHIPLSRTVSQITGKHIQNAYRTPTKLLGLAKRLGHSVFNSQSLRLADKRHSPPLFFMAPTTPFNRAIEKQHNFSSAHLSLIKIKEIRKAYPGSTINDVVLAICSGALRAQLDSQGELPKHPLVAMIPVSKREKDNVEAKENGNSISPMLVSLATNIKTAKSRLGTIHQNTLAAKKFNRDVAIERIMKHLPSWSSSLTIKAYTHLRLANFINPVFNLIITNVPGPRTPLYLDGAELRSLEGIAPIVDGMGLTMVITSYIDTLTISITSCESMSEQTHQLTQYLEPALEELHQEVALEDKIVPFIAA